MFTRLRSIKNTTTSLFRYTNATRSCDFGKKNEQVYHKHHQNRRRRPPYPNTHSRKCDFAYQILNRKMVVIENFAEPNRLLDTLLSIVCPARKVFHLQKAHECNAYLQLSKRAMNLAESLTLSHQIFEGSHPPRQISIFCTQNKNLCMPQNKKKKSILYFQRCFSF